MSKTVSVRVSDEIHQKFLENCNKKGTTMNDRIKEMIHGEVKNPITKSEKNKNEDNSEEKNHFSDIVEINNKIDSIHKAIYYIKTKNKQQDELIDRLVKLNHLKTMSCVILGCNAN